MFKCTGFRMAHAKDLKIRIPLTPSQASLFPEIIEKLNSEPAMMMDRIELTEGFLEVSCHDLSDILNELEIGSPLELHRFKKQAESALQESILSCGETRTHQRKNLLNALKTIQPG